LAKKPKTEERVLAANRAASHEYHLLQRLEAGIVLTGTEVKSARAGSVNLKDAYARIKNGEIFLHNAHISPYDQGNRQNHEPRRTRKLLLHAREIRKLDRATISSGTTIVATKIYLKKGLIKVEIALAKGKKLHDKRESSRKREMDQEMARAKAESYSN
jgi:SsrA-binding protein